MEPVAQPTGADVKYRNLINWQAAHLGEALWGHQNGFKMFESLEPVLPIERPRYGAIGMSNRRPAVLCINVSALADAAIPAHTIHLMATDYDAALKSLLSAEREAWNDYLGKAKRSSIYGAKVRTRKRVENGAVVSTRRYCYLEPNDGMTPMLERAVKKILSYCDAPSRERLTEIWNEQELLAQSSDALALQELGAA